MDFQLQKVGLLGGSFDPPHFGHFDLARLALEQKKIDHVWVIPCFIHPFGKQILSFEHRFAMCQLAFQSLGDRVQILKLEKELGGISYTLRTLEALQKKFLQHQFFFIAGEDTVKNLSQWKDGSALQKKASWLIFPRGETSPVRNVSATAIRKALEARAGLEEWLPKNVIAYIEEHRLYGV